jgi:hypothetical protein
MSDEYLWDGSGAPDEQIAGLEHALAPLSYRRRPLPQLARRRRFSMARTGLVAGLSLAATVALVTYTAWFAVTNQQQTWHVSTLGGVPRVNDRPVGASASWRVGDTLETDERGVAQVDVGMIGSVEVGPNSVATLERARGSEHRMGLERGSIRAIIWAPPGLFFVDTPSAVAVDLGCAYTLDVQPDGSGLVRVEHGWVGFRDNGRESFIPQGAACATRRGRGPGTPYYEDAPEALIRSLAVLDFGDSNAREEALEAALSLARPRDALSVWHLITRTRGDERARVIDRLIQLAPPPAGITREGVLAGNRAMLDAWWDTLGLESASWWRMWETPWAR